MKVVDYLLSDVLVIGGGTAGCRAAIEASEHSASVVVVDRKRTGAQEEGHKGDFSYAAACTPVSATDNWRDHYLDTIQKGERLGDPSLAAFLARDALREAWELERYGFRWRRDAGDNFDLSHADGHSSRRIFQAAEGFNRETLADIFDKQLRKHVNIYLVEGVFITNLLQHRRRVVGAVGILEETGELMVFTAGSVIMATGRMNDLFTGRDGGACGQCMAYRKGAALIDLEFQAYIDDEQQISLAGLQIDEHCQTSVPGLYAVEGAAGGVHGADYLSGNALPAALVFGSIAGRSAALSRHPIPRIMEEGVKQEIIRLGKFVKRSRHSQPGLHSVEDLFEQLTRRYRLTLGPQRSGPPLQKMLDWLRTYDIDWYTHINVPGKETSPSDLLNLVRLDYLLQIARLSVKAAFLREESRGIHKRIDFPEHDPHWNLHIISNLEGNQERVEKQIMDKNQEFVLEKAV